jgi:putative ATP-dependent endonuclease of OLD family
MLIQSFAVDNFRGINGGLEQNQVNFDGKNAIFLFGQNNVGKSSFLRAYESFYEDSVNDKDFSFSGGKNIVMEISLFVDESTEKDEINKGTGNKFDNIKQNYLDSNGLLRLRKTWLDTDRKKSVNETFNTTINDWEQKAYAGIGWATVFQPLLMRPLFINAMPTEQDVQNIVTEVLREVATSKLTKDNNEELAGALKTITDLQDKVYNKNDIDAYKADVNTRFESLFNGYKIDIDDGVSRAKFTQDKVGKDFKVSFVDKDNNSNDHGQMGHGAVRMAIFLLMLLRDKLRGEGVNLPKF